MCGTKRYALRRGQDNLETLLFNHQGSGDHVQCSYACVSSDKEEPIGRGKPTKSTFVEELSLIRLIVRRLVQYGFYLVNS